MNSVVFQLMSLEYKVKSLFLPPEKALAQIGIKASDRVVDYGCGPGRYTIPLARMLGDSGTLYAVDIHPLALKKVNKKAGSKGIKTIVTMLPAEAQKIEANSIDAIILFDTLHDIKEKDRVLQLIDRLLKKGGLLAFKDHHIDKAEIQSLILNNTGLVLQEETGKGHLSFGKT